MDIEQQVLKLVTSHFEKTQDEVINAASWKDIGLTSLDSMEIIFILEDEFDMEIPDDEYPNLSNFRKLVDFIKEHKND
jgi:acyl carrier protein